MAAGSSITHYPPGPVLGVIQVDIEAAADGSVADIALPEFEGHIVMAMTDPGATQPQDNWDYVVKDAAGFDRLGGIGANRDTLNTEVAVTAAGYGYVNRHEPMTLSVSGNNVNGAQMRIGLYYTTRV